MKAILLSAGYGTRLRPITNKTPKCLVKIKEQPILDIWLETLDRAGIDSYLINSHYLHEMVKQHCKNSKFKDKIFLTYEKELLGTAGTLIKNLDFFEQQDGILLHTDNYFKSDFKKFIYAHKNRPQNCLMTMIVFKTKNPEDCGICKINDKKIMVDFFEKEKNFKGNIANGAVYILSSELIKKIKTNFSKAKNFSTEILPHLKNRVFCYETKDIFIDIGSQSSYFEANKLS